MRKRSPPPIDGRALLADLRAAGVRLEWRDTGLVFSGPVTLPLECVILERRRELLAALEAERRHCLETFARGVDRVRHSTVVPNIDYPGYTSILLNVEDAWADLVVLSDRAETFRFRELCEDRIAGRA